MHTHVPKCQWFINTSGGRGFPGRHNSYLFGASLLSDDDDNVEDDDNMAS